MIRSSEEAYVPSDRQNISARKSSQFYVNRVRRILQHHEIATLEAVGAAMSVLVEAVEILKREKVVVVNSISTSQVSLERNNQNNVRKPKLNVVVSRGEKALILYGYRKRKVLELFDELYSREHGDVRQDLKSIDTQFVETLDLDFVKQLSFEGLLANEAAADQARAYLDEIAETKNTVNLEEWTQYLSYLVSPSLSNDVFDNAINSYMADPSQTQS